MAAAANGASDFRLAQYWHRICQNRMSIVGLAIVGSFAVLAIFADLIAPYDPNKMSLGTFLAAPSLEHPFGKDALGRDILSRIIFGARISMLIGVAAVAWSAVVGVILGLVSAYFGGWVDNILMRLTDILMAFPPLLLAITIISIIGTGITNLIIAVGAYTMPGFIRVARSAVLSVKEYEFVEASRAIGYGHVSIMISQILPNILGLLAVQATLTIGRVVLEAAGLSFLGLGVPPGVAEWGIMLSAGRGYLQTAAHVSLFPGLAILMLVLGFNMLGDGLRDFIDPRFEK